MSVKDAILKTKIQQEVIDLMVKTRATNIILGSGGDEDEKLLIDKIQEIVTVLNTKAKSTDVQTWIATAVSNAKDELIGGAPETYDTLKEIADYISSHQNVVDGINAAIGNKADKAEFEAVKTIVDGLGALAKKDKVTEGDLDTALAEKVNAASEGNHSHANKEVLDSITSEKVQAWDGKSKIYVQDSQPETLAVGELWIEILPDETV